MKKEIIGFDVGRTIVQAAADGEVKQAYPDALRVITRLVAERFGTNSYLISKVNERQEAGVRAWLSANKFHEVTGVPADHLFFCPERSDKAAIAEKLGITHFIDDRPEVFHHMVNVPNRYLFRAVPEDVEKYKANLGGIVHIESWVQFEKLLLPV